MPKTTLSSEILTANKINSLEDTSLEKMDNLRFELSSRMSVLMWVVGILVPICRSWLLRSNQTWSTKGFEFGGNPHSTCFLRPLLALKIIHYVRSFCQEY